MRNQMLAGGCQLWERISNCFQPLKKNNDNKKPETTNGHLTMQMSWREDSFKPPAALNVQCNIPAIVSEADI